jgi:hypothetical protein
MKLAWLRGSTRTPTPFDDSVALIEGLRRIDEIEIFTSDRVQDFATAHERRPFDLAVYELDNATTQVTLWPFLSRFGGALMLRTLALPDLRATLMASRVAVVPHESVAEDLRVQYPTCDVRVAVTGVSEAQGAQQLRNVPDGRKSPVCFGLISDGRADVLRRSRDRACLGDETALLMTDRAPEQVLGDADVIVSLQWPWFGEPATRALAAMAVGKPVVVLETAGTADWPALDPQTWQPRGPGTEAPIVVSVDPLDEEHSLGLVLARLSADSSLRTRLGAAAKVWWKSHATPEHATAAWTAILNEYLQSPPVERTL